MFKKYETQLAGRTLSIETGKIAELANGSVVVRYGETVVMVNVTAAKEPKFPFLQRQSIFFLFHHK